MKLGKIACTLFALVAMSVTGCAAQRIDDRADQKLAVIQADANSMRIESTCADGEVLTADCGLVTARVAMPDFREKFRAAKCESATPEECQARLDESVDAWLGQRYMLADFRGIDSFCNANPASCADANQYELRLLRSHDDAARSLAMRRADDVEDRRQAEHAIDDARAADAALLSFAVVAGATLHHRHY